MPLHAAYASVPLHAAYASVPLREQTVSRLRGINVSCIHLSCQENCWQVVNSMGKLVFVSDNSNQFTKLENFGEMFSFQSERETG